ncbi:hypothetical protein [Sphingomonas japonica]|uniref:Uncharacterized membrane protein YgdD (TMEM256/DUF423 family) n=1 Tax=Sphingomonas japonica TaxID=511662 RepID=A0ABX0U6H4_9SPHN|nr:hypothetical protein [Sphingomonas japonica]NIJ25016.1 uncharacterized membrane protein YgdD (TMEM256/DUF423 family) [Sphingomonas japonica]
MTDMLPTILTLLMLASFALIAGGLHLILRRKDRRKGALMLACAAVFVGNIVILTI